MISLSTEEKTSGQLQKERNDMILHLKSLVKEAGKEEEEIEKVKTKKKKEPFKKEKAPLEKLSAETAKNRDEIKKRMHFDYRHKLILEKNMDYFQPRSKFKRKFKKIKVPIKRSLLLIILNPLLLYSI